MKSILTIILSCSFFLLQAQNFIDKNFDQYEELDQTTVVHVSSKTFAIASYVIPSNDEEERELKEFVASVNSLDLIAVEDLEGANSEYRRGVRILEGGYDELVNIKDKSNLFSFFIDSDDEVVYELVGIGINEDDFFVVSITGEMKLDLIAAIISKIQTDEFAPLAKLKEYDATQFEIYPNPINTNTKMTIEIPEGMIGGKATVFDMKGSALEGYSITDRVLNVNTNNMEPGTYVISLEKDDISLKKQVIVVR